MAVRGTTNYVYFTDRTLGAGASGTVYFGRHKRRGDPCAIKVFRSVDGGAKEMQLRQREFNVMSKLNHDNIVKFIAIELESHGSEKVLVMELCTGGSVYEMLADPENAFGFPEDEFLTFLNDITKALQYLRKNGVVHRDIKPGNILRYIKDDLGSVYKLTDFGAARELPEDGEFVSLYGTEEYLHPDLYARALMRHHRQDHYPRSFNASVDLWSLGVTLYHVATGRLPFQPFGGRKNREAMHMIISNKDSGFISGVQQTKGGSIEWSRDLPKTCSLSGGLKKLLVPILVGLLESEKRCQWTFDKFFHASKDIVSRTVVHIFSASNCSQNRLYLGNEERTSLTHFQDVLADFTNISSGQQLLFHERWSVEKLIVSGSDEPNPIQTTSLECPIFVMPKSHVSTDWKLENCDLPNSPSAPSVVEISEDAAYSRNTCAYVMFIRERTNLLLRAQDLLTFGASHLGKLLTTRSQELQLIFDSLVPMYEKLLKFRVHRVPLLRQFDEQFSEMAVNFKNAEDYVAKLSQDFSSQCSLLTEFLKTFVTRVCPPSSSCSKKQAHIVKELETIKDTFKDHKKKDKDLSYNEQQIHKFDRGRIADGARRSFDLYTKHCLVNTEASWKAFLSYYRLYAERKSEIEQAENYLLEILNKITATNENLFNLLLKLATERSGIKDKNGFQRMNASNMGNENSWSQSDEDSAFVNDVTNTVSHDDKTILCTMSENHITAANRDIFEDATSEEMRADSGIEMLTEKLKDILKDTSDLLKVTASTSDENESLLQKLRSHILVSTKS